MHLLSAAVSAEEIEYAIEAAGAQLEAGGERIRDLLQLWRATPHARETIRAVRSVVGESGEPRAPEQWAAVFDKAAAISPEAGVALYSLGRADLLEAATNSIVARLGEWGLLGVRARVLDLGCGMGRLAAALAREVVSVVGVDVSAAMLQVARTRYAGLANATFRQSSGRDLDALPAAGFDLVTPVDVFPYLVAAEDGLAARHVQEIARVRTPAGSALIVNYSYRGDPDRDLTDVQHHAGPAGLELVRYATGDFAHWDGRTFLLSRRREAG
jgi:SAM-dependent methyltransferase